MTLLSLKDAAAAVGKDPSTLTRAVKKGILFAETDPSSGQRRFDPLELIRMYGKLKEDTPSPQSLNALVARMDKMEAKIADNDNWKHVAESLIEVLRSNTKNP